MIDQKIPHTTISVPQPDADLSAAPSKKSWSTWQIGAMVAITLISIAMNFYQLGKNGYSSYYPAAIKSMMDSWHNFFYVSYDPGGFVSIDKPPVGFWLDVLSAKIFGFNTVSILLPSAISGVLAVIVLAHLVKRHFGATAGILAALALALNPISILTNRNITIDSTLTLVILLGAWAVMRAAETGKLRWLLLTAVLVGIGFNIKMLEAYLVVPAYGLLYLLAAPGSIWKRIRHLIIAGMLMLVISLSWVVAVDLTPASQRPYVGSTQNNSELSLALGYNGVQRLLGSVGGTHTGSSSHTTRSGGTGTFSGGTPPSGSRPSSTSGSAPSGTTGSRPSGMTGMRGGTSGGSNGAGNLFDIGTAGVLRLFIQPLAGQIAWLLPFALLGAVALAWQRRPRVRSDLKQQSLVLWGTWLLTMGAFFSVAGFFHQYYMTVMSPAIAALFGIGMVTMVQDFRKGGWRAWMLPIAIVLTAAEQVYILSNYPAWGKVLIPVIVSIGILVVGTLVSIRLIPSLRERSLKKRVLSFVLGLAVIGMLITPTVWASVSILQSTSADTLVAGPTTQTVSFTSSSSSTSGKTSYTVSSTDSALISYLEKNQGSAKYLVAVTSSNEADSIILATNKPVMTVGGFSGSDPILTTTQLAALVKSGEVKYFLISGNGGMGGSQSSLTTWVKAHGTLVSSSTWSGTSSTSNSNNSVQLYKLSS